MNKFEPKSVLGQMLFNALHIIKEIWRKDYDLKLDTTIIAVKTVREIIEPAMHYLEKTNNLVIAIRLEEFKDITRRLDKKDKDEKQN